MKIQPFKLERYFAKYEFSAPYLLSCSDCEPLGQSELLAMADEESKKLWNDLILSYTHSQGLPLLRQEIAKLYSKISLDELIILAPEEGIFIALNVLINKGDHVISIFPAYQSLYEIAKSIGASISNWEPNTKGSFEVDDLFSLATDKTKLIIINFPHNPTGETISGEQLQQIIEFARKKDIIIFSDEMYRLLEYDSSDRLKAVGDIYEKGISLGGMSKSFALPGLRLGWLGTQNKSWIRKMIEFKDYTTICPPAPSEILALIALRNKEHILNRNLTIIKNNLVILEAFIDKYSAIFKWNKPKAGPITFPELIIQQDIDKFCKDLVDKKGLMLLPSSVYDYPHKKVRISLGRKTFGESLTKLDEYLTDYS
ncbi:MAG: aminotransferase class I/II-fold pyridoxal phosphate-dependent enzyme [Bacteroidetes bacterium]|nr:aminotransferase class I/II-fold pyridoxal phosphate-dependent enzyme [Bacteroidota bacterium]